MWPISFYAAVDDDDETFLKQQNLERVELSIFDLLMTDCKVSEWMKS